MPQILLDGARVDAVIGQFVAARMAQHVDANREVEACQGAGPRHHLAHCAGCQRSLALGREHKRVVP